MNKANAKTAAGVIAQEYRKNKGKMVESSYTASMMVNVLIAAGINVKIISERKGDYGVKITAVIVDGEKVEV